MVQYSKELQRQLYTKWENDYIQYKALKKVLKQPNCEEKFHDALRENFRRVNRAFASRVSELNAEVEALEANNDGSKDFKEKCDQTGGRLVLLDKFALLNYTGFRKIMKKFSKVTGNSLPNEFKNLDSEPFFSSKESGKLIARLEEIRGSNESFAARDGFLMAAGQFEANARPPVVHSENQATASGPVKVSPKHGYAGRIIVVEGLDGSGKSTQLDLLRSKLEVEGYRVIVTRWNSSALLSTTIKKVKRARELTAVTFSMMQATDLAETTERIIKPALSRGEIVICDRYFYTSLARDTVRGSDPIWLRSMYNFTLEPDLILYFRVPVEVAIGRVMKRRLEGGDESDGSDTEESGQSKPPVSYYEAGLDMQLSEDPIENFHLFQSKVKAQYDTMASEYRFRVVDAGCTRQEMRTKVNAIVGNLVEGVPKATEFRRNPFVKDPKDDREMVKENYLAKRGDHFFFRNSLIKVQTRFSQLVNCEDMPKVFLHGNPHIDNYAKSSLVSAMVDYDRSCNGPYAFDLVRLMISVSLRQASEGAEALELVVSDALKAAYLSAVRNPDSVVLKTPLVLQEETPAYPTTSEYCEANYKWAKEVRDNPILTDDPKLVALLNDFLANRNELDLLDTYWIEDAGKLLSRVSEEQRERLIAILAPKDASSGLDRIMIDIKVTRNDPDNGPFKIPFDHQGVRMTEASKLYAPEAWEKGVREGHATYEGVHYWGRQIDVLNGKIKKPMTTNEQIDFVQCVGSQLGRGHARSVISASPDDLVEHLEQNWELFLMVCDKIRNEVLIAHRAYVSQLIC